ncbi:MAG: type II toxin-antitoxin system RelE/ParE family toxin [Spirochaetota bacterium]
MAFEIRYHPYVKSIDLPLINEKIKKRIKAAIETRLTEVPHHYGEPLRKTLKGYWKLRVGDYRIVFKIKGNFIFILGIIHRKKVYEKIGTRT